MIRTACSVYAVENSSFTNAFIGGQRTKVKHNVTNVTYTNMYDSCFVVFLSYVNFISYQHSNEHTTLCNG